LDRQHATSREGPVRTHDRHAVPERSGTHRASRPPSPAVTGAGTASGVLGLQRAAGNAAVARLIQRQQQPVPLERYELTLPEFVGNPRLEQAKLNDPPVKRRTDRTGPAVYAIQKALILAGHRMPRSTKRNEQPTSQESPNDPAFTDRGKDPDGVWGDETDAHVRQFQRDHQLSPDARVGNKTLKALQEAAATPVPQPILPAGTMIAGVDSFTVAYDKDPVQDGRIRIDVEATFLDDATHSAAVAEYQQFVSSRARIRRPDGTVIETPAALRNRHDDGWHRDKDRVNDRPQTFVGNTYSTFDVAGIAPLEDDEVLDFRFTAEHLIVDLARNQMVIASRGPHTVVVKGRKPRTYQGAPIEL
jgi:hypothetical protein